MALVYPSAVTVEVELSGEGNGWTTLADVAARPGIQIAYGIQGNGPNDRVAGTGTMTFQLKNGLSNSVSTVGFYSPAHTSSLSGWDVGIGARLGITYSGTTYYKFRGLVEAILPSAGQFRQARVMVTCVDWMDESAKAFLRTIPERCHPRLRARSSARVAGC